MKGKNLLLTAVLALAAGVALIWFRHGISSSGVVTTGGILFIVAGFINLLLFEGHRKQAYKNGEKGSPLTSTFSWLTCAASVLLGLCMLVFRSTFLPLVPVMFGILIAFGALYQYYILAIGARPVMMPGWLYILPTIMAGGAVYVFVQPHGETDMTIMLVSGVAFCIFALSSFIEASVIGHYNRHPQRVVDHVAKAVESEHPAEAEAIAEHAESDIPKEA